MGVSVSKGKKTAGEMMTSSEDQMRAHNEQHPKTLDAIRKAHNATRAKVKRKYGDDAKPLYIDKK